MKKPYLFVVFVLVVMNACMLVQRQAGYLALDASSRPRPTETVTASPLPPATPTAVIPSATADPNIAPILPSIEVSFVTNGDRSKPYVALTFDLCQKPEYPALFDQGIYEILVKYDAPATFFMGGDWMRTHEDETRLLASNPNFELGNHSWSHPDLPGLSQETISSEIVQTQDMLYQLTGRQSRLFRLPAGLYDDLTLSVIAAHGLYTIQWDVVTGDPDPNVDAEYIDSVVRQQAQNGSIIIMHANGRGWNTAEALPRVIRHLREQGFTLVTVSQLLGLEPIPTP